MTVAHKNSPLVCQMRDTCCPFYPGSIHLYTPSWYPQGRRHTRSRWTHDQESFKCKRGSPKAYKWSLFMEAPKRDILREYFAIFKVLKTSGFTCSQWINDWILSELTLEDNLARPVTGREQTEDQGGYGSMTWWDGGLWEKTRLNSCHQRSRHGIYFVKTETSAKLNWAESWEWSDFGCELLIPIKTSVFLVST